MNQHLNQGQGSRHSQKRILKKKESEKKGLGAKFMSIMVLDKSHSGMFIFGFSVNKTALC